jgi:hypothetical protein
MRCLPERKCINGHLDHGKSRDEIMSGIQALAALKPPEIGRQLRCDTSSEVDLVLLAGTISEALERIHISV